MASELFNCASLQLEQCTDLDRLEARGTLRLTLKSAGLDPIQLTLHQLQVVFDKLIPEELCKRGIDDAQAACARIMEQVSATAAPDAGSSADEIFQRLGGD